MRLILEVVVVAALVAFAWDKSYRERVSQVPLVGEHLAPAAQPPRATRVAARNQPQPSPTISNGAWMWDPNHKTALDRPAPNKDGSFTGHVFYTDEHGKKYWLDAQGQRHYEP